MQSFFLASARTGWPVLLGLNLAQDSGDWAAKEINEGLIPNSTPQQRLGVEIGNEPDGYYEDKLADGVTIRPSSYQLSNYIQEFQDYLSAFSKDVPTSVPDAGPAFAGRWHQPQLDQFLSATSQSLSVATMHWYPTVRCDGPVTIADLLDPAILTTYQQVVGGWQQTAENHGLGLQLTETNSTACSGMPGVSDAFASTIWGLDWMLYSAGLNLRRINFHSGSINGQNSYYNAIDSTPIGQGQFTTQAKPLYYAMHLFESAGPGTTLYPVAVQSAANITAYATSRCGSCPVHVFAINKDLSASSVVTVSFGQAMGPGFELTLSAPGLDSMASAISYGGQQFDNTSGALSGTLATASVSGDGNGNYTFSLANSSAVLLTVLHSEAAPPSLSSVGIVSAAANIKALAPGSLASAFGDGLAYTMEYGGPGVLPTRLAGAQLTIGGVPAPETYASAGQINFQVPFQVAPGPNTLIYANGAMVAGPIPIVVSQYAPAIFTVPQVNSGNQGAILLNGSSSLAAPSSSVPGANPASRGDFISIFCTGLGAVQNPQPDGVPAPSIPLSETVTLPTVSIGGINAPIQFSGLAPNYSGLYQVNAQIPLNVAPGDAVTLTLSIGSTTSNSVTFAVK